MHAVISDDTPDLPTLQSMHKHAPWLWLDCLHCTNRRPVIIAHLMMALGVLASADRVRAMRSCGQNGGGQAGG